MRAVPGLFAFLVGAGLLSGPWWSSTLQAGDYALVMILGVALAAIGAFAALPETWPRLRTAVFALFMGAFGLMCAALALAPLHPSPDGTLTIGGVAGFAASGPVPWWARFIAGFFAIICLGAAAFGVWGLLRDLFGWRGAGGADPPEAGSG